MLEIAEAVSAEAPADLSPAPDYYTPEAYIDGLSLLALSLSRLTTDKRPAVILERVQHAHDRLAEHLASHLFGGKSRRIADEQHALAHLKLLALSCQEAASALDAAAEYVKLRTANGMLAGHLKQAATKAHRAADQWVNT